MTPTTTTTEALPVHEITLADGQGETITLRHAAPTYQQALAELKAAGWEIWRRVLVFPRLAIDEVGQFDGRPIRRISAKLYRYEDAPRLSYSKANMLFLAANRPVGVSTGRPMRKPADLSAVVAKPDPVAAEIAAEVLRKVAGRDPLPAKPEAVPCPVPVTEAAVNAALEAYHGAGSKAVLSVTTAGNWLLVTGDGHAMQARAAAFVAGYVAALTPAA